MSTPVGKPARHPNVLDYAPRHVREGGGGPHRVGEEARPPRQPAEDEPLGDPRPDDEQYDVPLAPEAPHDDGDTERRVPRYEAQESGARQRGPERTEFDDDFAQLAALLESIRRGDASIGSPQPTPPRRAEALPPLSAEREPDIYIDGLRVPRSLQPPFEPRPLPADGTSYLKMAGGVTAACVVAAALAFVMVGGWHPSTSRSVAHNPSHRNAAAAADQPVAPDAQRGARLASAPPPPARVAFAEPALNGPPGAAPQKMELASVPSAPRAVSPAPHAVPVVRVAPWPAETPRHTIGSAPPVAPPSPAAPAASPAQPPSPPPPQATMDAAETKLMLEQGKQFVAVGDLVTARTVLQRVADADVAAGALALAKTYDPAVLARLGVRGLQGDVDQARHWYERALELGADEATQPLAQLTRQ
jgi:hypothetical protein